MGSCERDALTKEKGQGLFDSLRKISLVISCFVSMFGEFWIG